jgi:hypothetical protein
VVGSSDQRSKIEDQWAMSRRFAFRAATHGGT